MIQIKLTLWTVALLLTSSFCGAKTLKKIKVEVNAGAIERVNTVASIDLTPYELPAGCSIQVTDVAGHSLCVSQIDTRNGQQTLFWRIDHRMNSGETRLFLIEPLPSGNKQETPVMELSEDKAGNLTFLISGKSIFRYNTEVKKLPAPVDPAYQRNGYIHPVWSPMGSVLTAVNPPDHVHHYGIWNPWTSVLYDNRKYDLWNIGDKTGTVRFDSLYSTASGDLFADILVRHRHLIFQEQPEQIVNTTQGIYKYIPKKEIVIMDEKQGLRAWNAGNGLFVWELTSDLLPATNLPVRMVAYRYGGFCFRATADWQRENCRMLTSEGKPRPEVDGSRARWIFVTGDNAQGPSGILFLASPGNHSFPEPLRVWDADGNGGRGDVMLNFAPSKFDDWLLEPQKQYRLQYRIVTFDGDMTADRAEQLWQEYAHPVAVRIL